MRLTDGSGWRVLDWLLALVMLLAALGVMTILYACYGLVWFAGELLGRLFPSEAELDNDAS